MLDDMHKRKIDMADNIFVINRNGYIRESTESKIKYAESLLKNIVYLESCVSYEGDEGNNSSQLNYHYLTV